jgi:hypothetical protein
MPAIHPTRLKIQTSELVQTANNAEEFCLAYHEFLDFYADRTYRPGKVGEPPPLMRAYKVPQPVLRAVNKQIGEWARENRQEALNLIDALWLQSFLEFRLTAASLMGQIEPSPVKHIISRVQGWIQPNTEERLVNALINQGLQRILIEKQAQYVHQIDIWLRSRDIERNRLGLKASPPLIARRDFDDYPLLYNALIRLMRQQNSPVRREILSVIGNLAEKTPDETAFFLENALKSSPDNTQMAWYVRNSLNYFPDNTRLQLRKALVA